MEEALTRIVDRMGEQKEHMSIRMSELERAVHLERESLRVEINRNRQEVSRSKNRLKGKTGEHLARNLSRITREAEKREKRLSGDLEQLRGQQKQTRGTLDTRIDAMMKRPTQGIMDRLEGLLGNRSGSRNSGAYPREASKEPRVNFNEHSKVFEQEGRRGSREEELTHGLEALEAIGPEGVLLAASQSQTNALFETHR